MNSERACASRGPVCLLFIKTVNIVEKVFRSPRWPGGSPNPRQSCFDLSVEASSCNCTPTIISLELSSAYRRPLPLSSSSMPHTISSKVTYAKAALPYPLFAADFDPYNRGYLVVGGGGGESKTGVPNQIVSFRSVYVESFGGL